MIKGSLVGVETQHVPSGRQEFCFEHQLQDNGLHVLEEREREGGEREKRGEKQMKKRRKKKAERERSKL